MLLQFSPLALSFAVVFVAGLATDVCRCFPGDTCWPTESEWSAFNETLGGRLVATKPIASVCHVDPFEPFDAQKCLDLQNVWEFPKPHIESSSSIMASFFGNRSCDPFLPKDAQCIIGSLIQYAVNATGASDYQKTIGFAQKNNIRLVIRNTGHDYLGKSSGAGALGIWTHHINSIEFVNYSSEVYTGKAVKVGAGASVIDVYREAHKEGLIVVGANGHSVGIAGGYSQGGGDGAIASSFGMAADQVLEWEVVTANGSLLTASPTQNSDLYWALSGGGGGTYGVVLSMTSRAYPDQPTSGANLTFAITNTSISQETFYGVLETFLVNLLAVLDSGAGVFWIVTNQTFMMMPTTAPGITAAQLTELWSPTISKLEAENFTYTYIAEDFPTFLANFEAMTPLQNVTTLQLGGRLIPRSLVETNASALVKAIEFINDSGGIVSGVSINVTNPKATIPNSVNPVWRTTVINMVLGTEWDTLDWDLNLANQELMTNVLLPPLEKLTPNGGAYLNEADFNQPDFQSTFYGDNYDRLKAIKNKYDPNHLFYALTAVGSEVWTEQADGRLCLSES